MPYAIVHIHHHTTHPFNGCPSNQLSGRIRISSWGARTRNRVLFTSLRYLFQWMFVVVCLKKIAQREKKIDNLVISFLTKCNVLEYRVILYSWCMCKILKGDSRKTFQEYLLCSCSFLLCYVFSDLSWLLGSRVCASMHRVRQISAPPGSGY